MIAHLKGTLEDIGDGWVILDVSGVGYQVSCSRLTLSQLGEKGHAASLHIQTVLRQDSLQLYGFKTRAEQDTFLLLTTVQGVGMRVGLAILSTLTPEQIVHAIVTQDKTAINKADGVGPKLAIRILTELKDKVAKLGVTPLSTDTTSAPQRMIVDMPTGGDEAISALVNLGYRRTDAAYAITRALNDLPQDAPLNDVIRVGLSHMARSA